jgi:hypothetical protein
LGDQKLYLCTVAVYVPDASVSCCVRQSEQSAASKSPTRCGRPTSIVTARPVFRQAMLATVRPNASMDSFGHAKHRSDYESIARADRNPHSSRHPIGPPLASQQQQLPSFRDVSIYRAGSISGIDQIRSCHHLCTLP